MDKELPDVPPIPQPKPLPLPVPKFDHQSPRTSAPKPLPIPGNSPKKSPRPELTRIPFKDRVRSSSEGRAHLPIPKPKLKPELSGPCDVPEHPHTTKISSPRAQSQRVQRPCDITISTNSPQPTGEALPKFHKSPDKRKRTNSENGTSSSPKRPEKKLERKERMMPLSPVPSPYTPTKSQITPIKFNSPATPKVATPSKMTETIASTPSKVVSASKESVQEISSFLSTRIGSLLHSEGSDDEENELDPSQQLEKEIWDKEGVQMMEKRFEKPKKMEFLTQWTHSKYSFKEIEFDSKEFRQFVHFFVKYHDGNSLIRNIQSLKFIYSKHLLRAFKNERKTIQNRHIESPKTFNGKKWRFMADNEESKKKEIVYSKFEERVAQFPWNKDAVTPILPVIHGTDLSIAQKICQEGFANTSMIDAGYFGSGIYFTSNSLYALPYVKASRNPTLILSMIIPGNPYPVTEGRKSEKSLMGAALKSGYQSHYVITERSGEIADLSKPELYDEFVIVIPYQALPVALIELSLENFDKLVAKWNRPIEPVRQAPTTEPEPPKERFVFLVEFEQTKHKLVMEIGSLEDLYSQLESTLSINFKFQVEYLDSDFNEYVVLKTLKDLEEKSTNPEPTETGLSKKKIKIKQID